MHIVFKYAFFSDLQYLNLENLDENKNYIYVGNHQSFFDVVLMGLIFPKNAYVIAKDSLKYIPYFGFLYYISGNFYINRGDSEKSKQTLAEVIRKIIAKKSSIFILPQGARVKDNKVTKLKRGFIQLAKETQTDILPFVISSYKPGEILFNFRTKKPIYLKICDKISFTKPDDEILEELKNLMNKTISELDAL